MFPFLLDKYVGLGQMDHLGGVCIPLRHGKAVSHGDPWCSHQQWLKAGVAAHPHQHR